MADGAALPSYLAGEFCDLVPREVRGTTSREYLPWLSLEEICDSLSQIHRIYGRDLGARDGRPGRAPGTFMKLFLSD